MNHTLTRGMLLAATALALADLTPVYAQEVTTNGDIIVTARRTEERLEDVPISVTVFSQAKLDAQNIFSPADLGTYTPSLSVNSRFGPEKATFIIRGFSQDVGTEPSVGVYFADVIALRGNGSVTSGNGAGVGQLFDLQNIQVLKGPQGTLQGRNTTGGAVMLVPRKPTENFGGYIQGSLGDYDMRRIQAVVNVPLNDTFRIRAGVDWQKRDGYLHNITDIGPDRLGNVNYIAARVSMVADLTPDLENYTIASYSNSRTTGILPKVTLCNPGVAFGDLACAQINRQKGDGFWTVQNSVPDPALRIRQWQVINTTTWRASDNLTIKNIASYGEYREMQTGDNNGTYFPLAPGLVLPTVSFNPGVNGITGQEATVTEELQLQGKAFAGRLNWQAGAYLEASNPLGKSTSFTQVLLPCSNVAAFQCTDVIGAGSLSSVIHTDNYNDKALYGQATYAITDKLKVDAGIRYTWDKRSGTNSQTQVKFPTPSNPTIYCSDVLQFNTNPATLAPLMVSNLDGCETSLKIKGSAPTWLLGLDYKPSQNILVYGKWSRGYRAGGLILANFGVEAWGPERLDDFEVGLKTTFDGPVRGYANVAAFYDKYAHQQVPVAALPLPQYIGLGGAQAIVNAGKSRIWGIEFDSSITPFSGLKIDGGYTYLNTKLQSIDLPPTPPIYQPFTAQVEAGMPLNNAPKHRVSLSANYTLPLSDHIGEISFGGTYTYTSSYNTVSPAASPLYKTSAMGLVNLNANWGSIFGKPIDLSFFMTNVTNRKYLVAPLAIYPYFGFEGATTNMPRMFGFSLKYRFGE